MNCVDNDCKYLFTQLGNWYCNIKRCEIPDDIDITQLSGWGIPERPSPSSPSSLGALEGSKHGRSVATGQPAEKPTGTAPNPCEAASA